MNSGYPLWNREGTVVLDPEIPEPARSQLAAAVREGGIGFGDPAPPAQPPAPPRHVASLAAEIAGGAAAGLGADSVIAAAAYGIGRLAVRLVHPSGWPVTAAHVFFDVLVSLAGLALLTALAGTVTACFTGWTEAVEPSRYEDPASTYHRRYVLPRRDMDQEAQSVWARVSAARDRIERSGVVTSRRIDSVKVSVVMPYHLWDIARDLASVSALRVKQQAILKDVDPQHPDVAVVLDPQLQIQLERAETVERLVRDLETFAARVEEADAARRREEAVRQLAELNGAHLDLAAQQHQGGGEMEPTGQISREVRDATQKTNEAIRRANEAGRNLILPPRPPARPA